jgi:hypothetical protein
VAGVIKAKEKLIIFNTELIPAIQNLKPGTWPPEPIDPGKPWKWQTRRIIKPQPQRFFEVNEEPLYLYDVEWNLGSIYPKYQPGDILWVRETWQKNYWNEAMVPNKYAYKASPETWIYFSEEEKRLEKKWRSPRFMPKAAARLWLEVKNVRVERLQEITEDDAVAEGCGKRCNCNRIACESCYNTGWEYHPIQDFMELWDTLYAKRGHPWENNDWVFVYEFTRTEARP